MPTIVINNENYKEVYHKIKEKYKKFSKINMTHLPNNKACHVITITNCSIELNEFDKCIDIIGHVKSSVDIRHRFYIGQGDEVFFSMNAIRVNSKFDTRVYHFVAF
jgi:hypothetical protein